jgi:hypothetical protein
VIAAQRRGLDAPGFSFAVQRALWAEERDIADLATLRAIAQASLGGAGAAVVCAEQPAEITAEWLGNLAEAERIGICGRVFVFGTEILNEATVTLNWPLAAALSMLLLVTFALIMAVYGWLAHPVDASA